MRRRLGGAVACAAAALLWMAVARADAPAAAHQPASELKAAESETAEAPGGAEPNAPELHAGKLGLQILNFGVLVFLLVKFGGPPMRKSLAARHEQLKAELAAAAEARKAAEARLAQQERRLAALEQEIGAMRASITQEAETEKARLVALAEERARRVRDETAFLVEQQVKEAEAALRRQAAETAVELAEQLVRRSLQPADRERLLDEFVGFVASPGAAATERKN